MASRAELEAQTAAQAAVVALAWQQLQDGWATLGLTPAAIQTASAVGAVQDLFADIVSAWGEVSGTLAADFYDDLRDQASPGGTFSAIVTDPLNRAQVDRLVINAQPSVPDVSQADVDAMLARLEGPTQRLIRQAQRDVLEESAAADPAPVRVRIARVPTGETTCAFCLVMASRGYVYRSVESAGGGSPENRWHDFCDCEQDVSWEPNPVGPDGYDPGELYGKYETAREAAGSGDLRKILRELRLQEGIR